MPGSPTIVTAAGLPPSSEASSPVEGVELCGTSDELAAGRASARALGTLDGSGELDAR